MSNYREHMKFSIFLKLAFAFVLIIVPFSILTLQMNRWGAETVEDEISKSMVSKINFYHISLETELKRITKQLQELSVDKNLIRLSAAGNIVSSYEKALLINGLLNQLINIKDSSVYIEDVSVYMPAIRSTLSTNNTIDKLDDEAFKSFYDMTLSSGTPITYLHGSFFINAIYPNPPLPQKQFPMFQISIKLSVENIKKSLLHFVSSANSGAVLMHPDWVIAGQEGREWMIKAESVLQDRPGLQNINVDKDKYIVAVEKSAFFGTSLVIFVKEDQVLGPVNRYRVWFWLLFGISIGMILLFSYGIFRIIHRPLLRLVRAFRKVEAGNMETTALPTGNDEFRYLYEQFNGMVGRLELSIQQVYETKILAQRSELKQLQSQINPHFLYNSFFILNEMVQHHDDESLKRFTQNLGNYFQFITRDANDHVSLAAELMHARTYVEIQTIRFADRIRVSIGTLPEGLKQVSVPRMILQPLIENAYVHGLKNTLSGGQLEIRIGDAASGLTIEIEDNGQSMTDEKLVKLRELLSNVKTDVVESTGMLNVHRRLRLTFGDEAGIELSIGRWGGLLVKLRVNVEEGCYVPLVDRG